MNKSDFLPTRLLPPPRLMPEVEPPGYFQENYIDSVPVFAQANLLELETYDFSNIQHLQSINLNEIIYDNPEVNELIRDKEINVMGIYVREHRRYSKENVSFFHIYNYTDNHTLELTLSNDLKSIIKIEKSNRQIAPNSKEIDLAIKIAKSNEIVGRNIDDRMIGQAILIENLNPQDEHLGKRLFDVQFGLPQYRLPLYKAIVDISTKKVISSRPIEQPKINRKEVCHD